MVPRAQDWVWLRGSHDGPGSVLPPRHAAAPHAGQRLTRHQRALQVGGWVGREPGRPRHGMTNGATGMTKGAAGISMTKGVAEWQAWLA